MTTLHSNLLIAAAPDFTAPFIYDCAKTAFDGCNIWMLGTGPLAGIPVDLAAEAPALPEPMTAVIYADASDPSQQPRGRALAAARNLLEALAACPPRSMVYISTTDVYGRAAGEMIAETAPADPATDYAREKLRVERLLSQWCAARGVNLAILRPAPVVGTGMGGAMRDTVNRIYRGTYRHVAGDTARLSVVHATDVARAAVMLLGHNGIFNLTDGDNPTRHDLAEALCSRLDRKRVYTLPLKKLKIMARIGDFLPVTGYNTRRLDGQLSILTFDDTSIRRELPDLATTPVTRYLTTHTYDADSL